MKERSVSISFRLPAAVADKLNEQGMNCSMSRGDYARRLVVEGLTDARWIALQGEIDHLQQELRKLRSDLKNAVGALLVKAGQTEPAEAKRFIAESLHD